MKPLNSPLEVGMRALVLLAETFPEPLDVSALVLLDHAMLHSGELLGPPSLHPDVPAQPGELGMKRRLMEQGLLVLMRAGLADMTTSPDGFVYQATAQGAGLVDIFEAPYVGQLCRRAEWAVEHYAPGTDVREATRHITERWMDQLERETSELGARHG
ncbi:ABC-three component system middle component 2 [Streptomyces adonidis]|uniref:ABC-three component system middle component 2 n=1 Tax=Streptomyces adonidis TaxID=3231367 RepID=UPI0034DABEA9